MLPWLRSAPYPALCPCEPLRPVGDLQAVSYGARSIQYSPLLPASKLQPRSTVERPHSGPICWVDIYTTIPASKEFELFTHHDIVNQYRKGLTAVVD